jgi:serine-type D-Ala-D-Ala carboxypeptidase (penicillin-binding protein 5/6)
MFARETLATRNHSRIILGSVSDHSRWVARTLRGAARTDLGRFCPSPTLTGVMARPRSAHVAAALLLLIGFLLGSAAFTGGTERASAQTSTPPEVDEPAAWIVVDSGSGQVLAARNHHEMLPPASIAKVMTALVAVERLSEDAEIEISELAASQPASKLGVLPGERYRLDDAIAAMMLESANDVSYAVAESTGGTLVGFAEQMNETADRYGMAESEFSDPAGLDDEDSYRGGPRMSAFDIAIMIRNAQRALPIAKWAAATTHEFDGPNAQFSLVNHNRMLPGGELETVGVNGFKTGKTDRAGNTLATTASRDGRGLIVVVLDTPDTYAWTSYLLDLGFATPADDEGIGEQLPAPRVSVRAQRERDRDEFLALVTGKAAQSPTASTAAAPDVTTFKTTAPITRIEPQPQAEAGSSDADAGADGSNSGGGSPGRFLAFTVVALTIAFVVRREQVKRQKRARAEARRQRAAMIRRGALPVVDGRYRSGQRTGNPPQAHIRIRKIDAPPEDDWEEWTGWDDEPPGPSRPR